MKRRNPVTALGGIDLLEESVHALRLAPPATLLCYYVGSAPFILGALFFWSDMSRSGLADKHLVPGAVAISLLFVWMKAWQTVFATKLAAQIAREPPRRHRVGEFALMIASQTFIQATGLFLIPVAANLLLPIAWVYAFYQNATAFGLREPSASALFRRSWKQARFAPLQNHHALSVLALSGFFVFLNVAITMLSAPFLLKMLTGLESTFALSIESSMNTTFIAAALGVSYLCFDPLIKAAYTLRCFYGEARTTGEDLRVALRSFRPAAATALILVLWFGQPVATTRAAEAKQVPPQNVSTERAVELNHSIDEVLQRPEYTWRSPRPKIAAKEKEESALWKRIRESARSMAHAIRDWLDKLFKQSRSSTTPASKFSFTTEGLVYVLIAVVAVIVGMLVYFLWKSRSRTRAAEMEAAPAPAAPDLERDDVAGDELPEDGWSRLAMELIERGDLRLAMRAFYLASLAHLAARNLVAIARFKSNRDYERELLRRRHALPDLTSVFSQNVSVFDRVWYGMHDINADLLQQFRLNVERIKAC